MNPFEFHGLQLTTTGQQSVGDCPFCGKENHFFVHNQSGKWSCKVCGEGNRKGGGNVYTFISLIHKYSVQSTTDGQLEEISTHKHLPLSVLRSFGVCVHLLTNEITIPVFNPAGRMANLLRYIKPQPTDKDPDPKYRLYGTPTLHQHLFNIASICTPEGKPDPSTLNNPLWICEGYWDTLSWHNLLSCLKRKESSTQLKPLIDTHNVIGVPGAGTFKEQWVPFLAGRDVRLLFDHDDPKQVTNNQGRVIRTVRAGYDGMRRITKLVNESEHQPRKLSIIDWQSISNKTR